MKILQEKKAFKEANQKAFPLLWELSFDYTFILKSTQLQNIVSSLAYFFTRIYGIYAQRMSKNFECAIFEMLLNFIIP